VSVDCHCQWKVLPSLTSMWKILKKELVMSRTFALYLVRLFHPLSVCLSVCLLYVRLTSCSQSEWLLLVRLLSGMLSGNYVISVKFNDQHITNSPFTVHVAGQQDTLQSRLLDTVGYQVCLFICLSVCLSACVCVCVWSVVCYNSVWYSCQLDW